MAIKVQVLVVGKLSQAIVLARAAYRDHDGFQTITGADCSQMVEDQGPRDTQVGLAMQTGLTPSL